MTDTTDTTVQKKPASRRQFLKGGLAAAGGAAALAAPQVSRAQTTTLRMQSSWGAQDVFQEMAKQYTDRVEKMTGGRLKFDLLPAGGAGLPGAGRLP